MKKISKQTAAKMQLEAAIDAFNENNDVAAITLGGACEEILGALCQHRGLENALDSVKKHAAEININLNSRQVSQMLNNTKNALKHADLETDDIEIDDEDVRFMLTRACINYMRLDLEPSQLINEFLQQLKQIEK